MIAPPKLGIGGPFETVAKLPIETIGVVMVWWRRVFARRGRIRLLHVRALLIGRRLGRRRRLPRIPSPGRGRSRRDALPGAPSRHCTAGLFVERLARREGGNVIRIELRSFRLEI